MSEKFSGKKQHNGCAKRYPNYAADDFDLYQACRWVTKMFFKRARKMR
jgi:hypothetical protein